MAEDRKKESDKPQVPVANQPESGELDVAGKSLSDALRFSFVILKVIMIVLVIAFLASGFRTIGPSEKGLVLRFGKIQGVTEDRVLGPGPHWVFPYPIDEVVKIPVEEKVNLAIDSFWYRQTKDDILGEGSKKRYRVSEKLNPISDGYCLTRSEGHSENIEGSNAGELSVLKTKLQVAYQVGDFQVRIRGDYPLAIIANVAGGTDGSDYNIVHSMWQLTYKIDDIEQFFKNVYVEDVKPGEVYFSVIKKSVAPLLQNVFEQAVVTTLVNFTIDEAIKSKDTIPRHVKKLVQDRLDEIESGIKVVSVYLTDITWPQQVDEAFLASITASQESQKAISEAKTYAENTLNEAGGLVAERLLATLRDENVSKEETESLWLQLAGSAQEKIAGARAYRTQVVETAKANAEYFQQLLPEYRKRSELVIQKIYQDAVESVLDNADEKFVIQPTEGAAGKELRIMVNRDPSLKPKSTQPSEQAGKER